MLLPVMLARIQEAGPLPVHAVPAVQPITSSSVVVSLKTREFRSLSDEYDPNRCETVKRGAPARPRFVVMMTTPLVARDPYMDDAAALFRISIDSMSFGFTSARRLTMLSCVPEIPPPARVIEFTPLGIEALLISTP